MTRKPWRTAKRRDSNEPAIIAALEAAGAMVLQLDEIDLAVGYRGVTYLVEVKNPEYPRAHAERRARQKEWRRVWPGGPSVEVENPEQALVAIGAMEAKP